MLIHTGYDPALVVLSIMIATLASYTALDLGAHVRATVGWISWAWIAAASLAMGGGIWSMHFVAMLAFRIPMPVAYDATLALASLLLAIAVTALGFIAVRRSNAPKNIVLAGSFMGIGIAGMHYTGMAAISVDCGVRYSAPLVALSVMIAIVAATVALWLTLRPQNVWQKLLAMITMGAAISGMHYTGMAAAEFIALPDTSFIRSHTLGSAKLALWISGTSALILCLALMAAFFDRRFRNLAEREAAARHAAERRFRLLVQGVTDYAIYMLDTQGRVANWNVGAQRSKGYNADEIVGQHFSRFFPDEAVAVGQPEVALKAALRDGRYENEGWRVRKDGSQFWGNMVIDPIREDNGTLIGFAVVTRDMTERRETQKALDEAKQQLFQAEKMEALGQLTGGVAHDFNNLLTVVMGNLELAKGALEHDAQVGAAMTGIDRALRSASQAATLTNSLLSFARRQALQPRGVSLNALVDGMAAMIRRTIGEEIIVQAILGDGLWPVYVDPNQLESCLLNLVINARDAMPQGGKVIIETLNVYLDAGYAARHEGVRPGDYSLIAVTDTGTGMPAHVMEHALEPFFTTKTAGNGSGLGLSRVFGFVKQSGGHLKIYSEPDKGTTIKIYLPRHEGEAVLPVGADEMPAALPVGGKETILMVEDEPDVMAYASEVLQKLGYTVIEAQNGTDALEALNANPETALLFTDVVIPGINGKELVVEALRRRPGLRVLYTTGYTSNAIAENGILARDAVVLTKPFGIAALANAVRKVLDVDVVAK